MKGMALLLVLSAPILFADITGKWSLEDKSHPALFIFKQDGASLTGRVASPAGKEEIPIQNGTVEGDRLKFQDHQGNKDSLN